MIKEFAMLADRSTRDQVHPPFSFSENSRLKLGGMWTHTYLQLS